MCAEVVVHGATAAGVCAAVAAARAGAQVTLLEPGRHVGGMVSGGLGYTDVGDRRVLGGLAAEFAIAVADHYDAPLWTWAGPEPHVAEAIFLRWLEQAGVEVVFGAALQSVSCRDGQICSITTPAGEFAAGVFIDAGYEGDLLAAAGVPHAVGREGRNKYGERFAGRVEASPGKHNFPPFLSPLDGDRLLPLVHQRPLAEVGSGDGGVMAYGYRVCLTRAADRLPFERRDGYDENQWELARRYFGWVRDNVADPRAGDFLGLTENLPGAKCDGNSIGPLSLNLLDGSNWAYPDAGPAERERIRLRHLNYTRDFLYFLGHDESVPEQVRRELGEWGLPADEFADTAHLPHQLYVREARRMLGEHVLTEHDLTGTPTPFFDSIAMGSYHLDIREVQRTWRWIYEHPQPVASVFNEGYLSVPVHPYQVPYRSLVPRFGDCRNLLVPVCVSASHVAFSSIRMEPQYEMLGQAAGTAAALAVRDGRPVQRVDVSSLQDRLRDAGAVLSL